MTDVSRHEERLLDLLAQRALEGLDAAEQLELNGLLTRHPEVNPDQFDEVIARLDAAPVGEDVPLPDGLLDNVRKQAESELRAEQPESPRSDRFAWWAAAAAAILAVAGWWSVFNTDLVSPVTVTPPPVAVTPEPTVREQVDADRSALILPWSTTDDPQGQVVTGDVHWSHTLQLGYMRFRDLPVNDPSKEQYQLWIFDATRNDAHPVDGGLFDVTAAGEVIVPIAAGLLVRDASLFAITVEPPGGVVVSDRKRLILLAQTP